MGRHRLTASRRPKAALRKGRSHDDRPRWTGERAAASNLLPYAVDVISMDHPGIVNNLAGFFADRNINIEDLATSSYAAAHTGTPMFSVHMTVGIPSDLHIAALREEFMDYCDGLNLDAVLEPIKG